MAFWYSHRFYNVIMENKDWHTNVRNIYDSQLRYMESNFSVKDRISYKR